MELSGGDRVEALKKNKRRRLMKHSKTDDGSQRDTEMIKNK